VAWNRQTERVITVGVCAAVIGVADSLIKGNGFGLLGALGQTAAPWLMLAFLAGAFAGERRLTLGAFAGLEATLLGLVGFYFVNSFVVDLGSHAWPTDLRLAVTGGKWVFALSVLSGPIFGALGTWWRRQLSMIPVIILGLLFVGEALVRVIEAHIFVQYVDQASTIEVLSALAWTVLAVEITKALRREENSANVR
jgi:hypothetical protein